MFELDTRLQSDCFELFEREAIHYLLHRNAAVTWFILVPRTTVIEFHRLPAELKQRLQRQIDRVAGFIEDYTEVDKVNIATIGNVVSQLHVHIIGRRRDDPYWPDVVWGKPAQGTYQAAAVEQIRSRLGGYLNG